LRPHIRHHESLVVDLVGAIVIDLAKGQLPKTDETAGRITRGMEHCAIFMHQYAAKVLGGEAAKPAPEHCIVFHTHRQERISAPDGYKRTLRNIEAVYRNIGRTWEVSPRRQV